VLNVPDVLTLPNPPPPEGLTCPTCGVARFVTSWQTFANGTRHVRLSCGPCGRFIRYLKQEGVPEPKYEPRPVTVSRAASKAPPESWQWLGLVRPEDRVWRAVALCPTLERCWDTLLTCPLQGDLLAYPVRPGEKTPLVIKTEQATENPT
jgi:hypothetical protein